VRPLLLIYVTTWLLQSIGQAFFWAMPGPAFIGFLTMGSFVFWLAQRQWRPQALDKFSVIVRTVL
jgi:hypothetical protein